MSNYAGHQGPLWTKKETNEKETTKRLCFIKTSDHVTLTYVTHTYERERQLDNRLCTCVHVLANVLANRRSRLSIRLASVRQPWSSQISACPVSRWHRCAGCTSTGRTVSCFLWLADSPLTWQTTNQKNTYVRTYVSPYSMTAHISTVHKENMYWECVSA